MNGIVAPKRVVVTRGDILGCGAGITGRALRKAVECGALKGHAFPGGKRLRFLWADVVRAFGLEGVGEGKGRGGE